MAPPPPSSSSPLDVLSINSTHVQQQREENDNDVSPANNDNIENVSNSIQIQQYTDTSTSTRPPRSATSLAETPTDEQHVDGDTDIQQLPLDWTRLGVTSNTNDTGNTSLLEEIEQQVHVIRYPQDVTEIDVQDTDLCIVGTAGQKITHIGSNFSKTIINPNCTSIILRSHLIKTIEGLQYCTSLQLLELYDNQIEKLSNLCNVQNNGCPGSTLITFDISYNSIRDMSPVSHCPNLQELYLANNKIREIAGLSGLKQLRKLDLGANRIRVMDEKELCGLINLEDLWLGKNKIEMIDGLESLKKLRRLDIQSNRLVTVENLTSQSSTLEELYLSHNAITTDGASISSGLQQDFKQLSILDLSRNQITSCNPFKHLITLEELWLSGNQIQSFDDVQPLQNITGLETIYLEYNPIQQTEPLYRKTLAELLPSLKQIDANQIGYVPYVHPTNVTTSGKPIINTQKQNNSSNPATTTVVITEEDRLRQLRDTVIARAQLETYGSNNNNNNE